MKQSSIEWLMEIDKSRAITIEEWQQAKAMHKAELLDTWEDSRIEYMGDDYIGKTKSFDDYYNETFNTKEK